MERILIVEDNKDMQFTISAILKEAGYEAILAGDGEKALKELKRCSPDMALLDIKLPGMDGMKVLEEMRKLDSSLVVIMLTAYGDIKGAVRALKEGAFDYITKPFDNEELCLIIKKALQTRYLSREVESLRKRLGEKPAIEEVMGESPKIKQVLKQVEIISPTNMTVIIQGESGTGKELIANMIHQRSLRKDKSFVVIDCGAIPETLVESELFGYEKGAFTGADSQKEGRFERADGGTLFLDEIANLTEGVQMKLLRVLQERKLQRLGGMRNIGIDVRIIAAANRDLSEAVRQSRFRDDLYHRLNEFQIALPPLRERKEDIPFLAKYFLDESAQELKKKIEGFSSEGMEAILKYRWPGNVRELKNVIKRAVLMADSDNHITPQYLFINNGVDTEAELHHEGFNLEGASLKEIIKKTTKDVEKDVIKEALAKAGGNKTKAAKMLKIDRMTLYSKIKEYQLAK